MEYEKRTYDLKPANREPLPPVFNKKTLFFFIFPWRRQYQSATLRRYLMDNGAFSALNIPPSEYNRIKIFNARQCAAIRRLLTI
jgi:hypothetical protein